MHAKRSITYLHGVPISLLIIYGWRGLWFCTECAHKSDSGIHKYHIILAKALVYMCLLEAAKDERHLRYLAN